MVLNLCGSEPDRVEAAAVLAPAASLAPFRVFTAVTLRLNPPRWAARPALKATIGSPPDDRLVRVMAIALARFRYQERSVYPDVFGDTALQRIHAPMLVMIGDKEIIYEPNGALRRAERLIANVETELIPGARHVPNMDTADVVNERVPRFFSEVRAIR